MKQDDDDRPATPEERARAQSLGRLIDAMLDGRAAPPALEAEERALLETATAIHAAAGRAALDPERRRALVAAAAGARDAATSTASLTVRPRPRLRALPWVAAAVCAAAAAVLLLTRTPDPPASRTARPLRSPDALVGPIASTATADASARIDLLYADRLGAYRRGRP